MIINVSIILLFCSGWFWVDPNLGSVRDALLVFCNFTSNETCVHPYKEDLVSVSMGIDIFFFVLILFYSRC